MGVDFVIMRHKLRLFTHEFLRQQVSVLKFDFTVKIWRNSNNNKNKWKKRIAKKEKKIISCDNIENMIKDYNSNQIWSWEDKKKKKKSAYVFRKSESAYLDWQC